MATPSSFDVLTDASIQVILDGQATSGAYVASPHFSQYGFAWLRDGSYCALAMDAVGQRESAGAFHAWVVNVVVGQNTSIRSLIERLSQGDVPAPEHMLPTRYTLDGTRESVHDDEWPNFQLDGYGTWLFALAAHTGGVIESNVADAAALAADYLAAAWRLPCFDYWEEFGDRVHTSTLAAVAAGLRAAASMLERADLEAAAQAVLDVIVTDCVVDGAFVKGPDDHRVDASLVSLATPFNLVPVDDHRMRTTISRIRAELMSPTGGVRRYVGDTYYGGSPWILLTAWLAWHLRRVGDDDGYRAARAWVEERAGEDGHMAEQITDEPQDAAWVAPWVRRWGPVADPLLWSHAKYLLMENGE